MSRQFWNETIVWVVASGTAIANSAAETILIPNITIPANYMQDGRILRITAQGAYGTTATPTLTVRLRWGGVAGTVMAVTGAIVTPSAVGGGASMTALWNCKAMIQTRSNGSTGTLMSNGEVELFAAGTATGLEYPLVSGTTGGTTPATATCDLTADTALSFTAIWGTANAANSIQCIQYTVESLN